MHLLPNSDPCSDSDRATGIRTVAAPVGGRGPEYRAHRSVRADLPKDERGDDYRERDLNRGEKVNRAGEEEPAEHHHSQHNGKDRVRHIRQVNRKREALRPEEEQPGTVDVVVRA